LEAGQPKRPIRPTGQAKKAVIIDGLPRVE